MNPGSYPPIQQGLLPLTLSTALESTMACPAPQDAVANDTMHPTTAAKCNAPGHTLTQLARPDLVGPFDASAHSAGDFNFSPGAAVYGRTTTKVAATAAKTAAKITFKIKAKRVKNRNAKYDTVRDAATLIEGLTHQPAMEAFQLASRMVPVHRSPRKRVMLETKDEEGEYAPEFEEFPEDLDLDLWDAKASIRNHLLHVSPIRSAATKRRVNGHERNWIRAHKMDNDVKYLLQFPGDMPAMKARDLISRRDMLALSVVEEDADGSLVMEMAAPSTAAHTSEASRLEKLEKAASHAILNVDPIGEQEEACDATVTDDEREIEAANTGTEPVVEETSSQTDAEPVTQKTHAIHIDAESVAENEEEVIQAETDPVTEEDQIAHIDADPVAEEMEVTHDTTEHIIEVTQAAQTEPRPVEEQEPVAETQSTHNAPHTPTPTKRDIVDVDLHTQSDIFASVMPQRHQEITPAVPAQPVWTATPTPRPASSPITALEVNGNISANWSPIAPTPGAFQQVVATPRPASSPAGALEVDEDISAHWSPIVSTPRVAPATPLVEEDDRTFLVRFMTKHQAGKTSSGAPKTPEQASMPTTTDDQDVKVAASTPSQHAGQSTSRSNQHAGTPVFVVARVPDQTETPVRAATSRPRAGRTPLGELDTNSPSPIKARAGKRKFESGPGDELPEGEEEHESPEPEKAAEPSPKRRRGLRTRKPAAPPTPLPATARAVRNGEKDLASVTRANTRANKGNAVWPEDVLKAFAADPMGQKWKERKEVVDAKAARAAAGLTSADAKNVRWAETIAEYRESPPIAYEDDEEEDELCGAVVPVEQDDVFGEKTEGKEDRSEEKAKEAPKPRARRGRPIAAAPAAAPAATKAATKAAAPKAAPKSKLPAPVSQTRGTRAAKAVKTTAGAPAKTAAKTAAKIPKVEEDKVVKRRPTRAAAQRSNLSMGLTATGTPIRRGRGRPKA